MRKRSELVDLRFSGSGFHRTTRPTKQDTTRKCRSYGACPLVTTVSINMAPLRGFCPNRSPSASIAVRIFSKVRDWGS